jgi:hypothetical protein
VKLDGWGGVVEAKTILGEAMHRYNATPDKPNF